MKLKYYLRGLGIGIICTAIIMGIALSGNKKETLTDTEIIERARLLGMVMEEEVTGNFDTDSSLESESGDTGQEATVKPEDETTPDTTEPDTEEEDDEPSEPADDSYMQEVLQIEIKPGEYSDVVCKKLYEAGLIEDANAFNQYLTQKGADASIRVGVHQIPKGSSQDEIIQILQQKTE